MNAPYPPFPPNPSVGQIFGPWVWNGSAWVCRAAGPLSIMQVFGARGNYTYYPSPGLTFAVVECIGGGGGGGGALAAYTGSTTPGWIGGGGGGGSGGYSRSIVNAALVTSGVPVTVGAGGAGGAATSESGGNGGDTSFGAFVVAHGGLGGGVNNNQNAAINLWGEGGGQTALGVGTFCNPGGGGSSGGMVYYDETKGGDVVWGGQGAGTAYGAAGQGTHALPGTINSQNGVAGFVGSGGDGASSALSTASATGGQGGDGICVITEWCFGDTSLVQPCPPTSGCCLTEIPTGWGTQLR